MLSLWKTEWSHFDLAILYNTVYPLREDPSVPSKVSFTHYATPLWAKYNRASPSRRTEYQSGHAHRDSAVAESAGKSYAVPSHIPSSKEKVRTPARLRMSESVDLLRFEQAEIQNFHFPSIPHSSFKYSFFSTPHSTHKSCSSYPLTPTACYIATNKGKTDTTSPSTAV